MDNDDQNKSDIVSPDGEVLSGDNGSLRAIEKKEEDEKYIPVIIKRTDEAVRHPYDTLKIAIKEGSAQYNRSSTSLFLSAVAAGLILGFAAMCVALVTQFDITDHHFMVERLLIALVYPLGFIVCIMSGTQLFTEQTATAVYPVLDKVIPFKKLVPLWCIVLCGNLFGTLISSALIYLAEPVVLGGIGFEEIYKHLIEYNSSSIFISAILAGWLMAQGGWLILATPPASSQIICIYVVTFIIGLGGLHHSIAGSAEIFSGLMHSENPDFYNSMRFLIVSIMGNLFGGSCFVAILNYGHIKQTQ
tara:strand:+ start:64433 stop:65341 length:909 start_codon:yes stop_codon:yes gene_type:complete